MPAELTIGAQSALATLESGFLPVAGFHPTGKTSKFVSKVDKQLRVEFLTPLVGGKADVYQHPALGVNVQPIHFLEFILEDIHQAIVLSAVGAVLVNVPDPARFSLHKLLVFADRRARNPEKALKDLRHAAALLEVLWKFRSDDVLRLWTELLGRGAGWRDRARKAVAALEQQVPELQALPPMKAEIPAATPPNRARGRKTGKKKGR